MRRARALIGFLLLWLSMPSSHAAESTASPAPPRPILADLAWIAGDWVGDEGGDLSEEVWAPPAGDCMMGMWRWVSGGKVKLFEFLSIVMEDDGPVFRLRHFDRQGVGWEDKDKPLAMKVLRFEAGLVAFEGAGSKGPVRLTYRRVDADALSVTLEKGGPPQEFRFRRKAAGR